MPALRRLSLKSLLLGHELVFLFLVAFMGALAVGWAYYWHQTAAESVRLNELNYIAQQVRSDLFRQIKEVTFARLTEDAEALALYGEHSRRIDKHFNTMRQLAANRDEDEAIQGMQEKYRVAQNDMNRIFADPYLIIHVLPIRIIDPRYEQALVGDFEKALQGFEAIIRKEQQRLDLTLARWTKYVPWVLPVPILLAVVLTLIARRWLQRGFVRPVGAIMRGARLISEGRFEHVIAREGVQEMVELAQAINQMAVDLARSREALVESEKSAALGSLVPVVAHNIRNPLASIRASAQLLDHAEDPADVRDIKKAIIDTVDRLGRWVSALVSYLHPLKPHRVRKAPVQLMEAALDLLKPRLQEKHMTVVREEWDAEAQFEVDPDLMEQAIYALMVNAVDASPEGAPLTVRAFRRADRFFIAIEDRGAGLPFQPNPSGLTPGPSTKRFGTGLGIPVAFKVCRAHGWKLEFETGENGGTRAVICVPTQSRTEWVPPSASAQ